MEDIDKLIETSIQSISFQPHTNEEHFYRFQEWKYVLALMAVYGIPANEVWKIVNLKEKVKVTNPFIEIKVKSVTFKTIIRIQGIVSSLPDNIHNLSNLLVIEKEGETFLRYPLDGNMEWIYKFDLLNPEYQLPKLNNPLKRTDSHIKSSKRCVCDKRIAKYFSRRGFKLTPSQIKERAIERCKILQLLPWQTQTNFRTDSQGYVYMFKQSYDYSKREVDEYVKKLKKDIEALDNLLNRIPPS